MNDILYVNDRIVDLAPGTVIATTISSIEVGNLTAREVTHTNQLKAIRSENNDITFGYSSDEHSLSSKPYKFLTCRLVQSGVETIPSGICLLVGFDNGYTLNILEEMFDVFANLDGKKLKDIDPIADTNWNRKAMDDYRNTTEGIISAIIWWGHHIEGSVFNHEFFLPSFYYHTIITKILENTGLIIAGDILTDSRFTDLIMPFNGESFDAPPSLTEPAPSFLAKGSAGAVDSGTDVLASPPAGSVGDLLLMVAMTQPGGGAIDAVTGWDLISSGNFNNDVPAPAGTAALYKRIADGTETPFNVTRIGSTESFVVQIYRFAGGTNITIEDVDVKDDGDGGEITWNAVTVGGEKRTLIAILAHQNSTDSGTPTGYTEEALDTIDAGAIQVALECNVKEDVFSDGSVTASGLASNGWITFHLSVYNNEDLSVDWNQYWLDVDVKDLVRDFFVRFSIIPKQRNGTLYLKSLESIIEDVANVMDWSEILVNRKSKSIKFATKYSQNNNFDYQDVLEDPTLGRGVMVIDNPTLPFSGTIYESPFEQSDNLHSLLYGDYAYIPVFDGESVDVTDFKNSPGLKLLTLKPRTDEDAITFFSTPRTDYKIGYFLDDSLPKDTGWQYFVDEFYGNLAYALQKNKVITKEYNLTPLHIKNFDSHKMMYDGEGYYIVNKIVNFVNGRITKVEVFKVL